MSSGRAQHSENEDPSSDECRRAEGVFREFLSRQEQESDLDIEALCEEHPKLADPLRALHGQWKLFKAFGGRLPGAEMPTGEASVGGISESRIESLVSYPLAPDRFQVNEELGHGGMGVVHRAVDEVLRRSIAIKYAIRTKDGERDQVSISDTARVARFLEEAQVTAQLDHPGVVPIHEVGVDEDERLYFTMRQVRGQDFKAIIELAREKKDKWSLVRAVQEVLLPVCQTMAFAHSKGVIHRDLKPANVMIGRFGEVYVLDWGLAKVRGRREERDVRPVASEVSKLTVVHTDRELEGRDKPGTPLATQDGSVLGTPCYMPPEQARGEIDEIGPASDVYSVGAMLYHLLTGCPPYLDEGRHLRPETILDLIRNEPPTPVHRLAPDVSPELASICEMAMKREIADRYQSTRELGDDLRAYLENRVVHAYRTGAAIELWKWVERNRGMADAIAASLVIAFSSFARLSYVQAEHRAELEPAARLNRIDQLLVEARGFSWEGGLWPPHPDLDERYRDWLHEARVLQAEGGKWVRRSALLDDGDESVYASNLRRLPLVLTDLAREAHSVEQRQLDAGHIWHESIEGEGAIEDWEEAMLEIASSSFYEGLRIEPVFGLRPLGWNEAGLYEFWHVQTGERPIDEDGRNIVREGTGLVFILLPTFLDEGGEPAFLSKYEMTQGQWERLTEENPSTYKEPPEYTPWHPVEKVSWERCEEVLARAGLTFPTSEEWEYAYRAGSTTTWPWGDNFDDMWSGGLALTNIADESAADSLNYEGLPVWKNIESEKLRGAPRDGFAYTAPVGTFPSNWWGFHEMAGNVGEWCSDVVPGEDDKRKVRGSSSNGTLEFAEAAHWESRYTWDRFFTIGIRPALKMGPPPPPETGGGG